MLKLSHKSVIILVVVMVLLILAALVGFLLYNSGYEPGASTSSSTTLGMLDI